MFVGVINKFDIDNGAFPISKHANASLLHLHAADDQLHQDRGNVHAHVLRGDRRLVRVQEQTQAPCFLQLPQDRGQQNGDVLPAGVRYIDRQLQGRSIAEEC